MCFGEKSNECSAEQRPGKKGWNWGRKHATRTRSVQKKAPFWLEVLGGEGEKTRKALKPDDQRRRGEKILP